MRLSIGSLSVFPNKAVELMKVFEHVNASPAVEAGSLENPDVVSLKVRGG